MNPFDGLVLREPPARSTVDELVAAARRRVQQRRIAAVAGAVAAIGAMAFALPALVSAAGSSDQVRVTQQPAATQPQPDRPSQSLVEARRDGVLPAIANLTFKERVKIIDQEDSAEGRWVISRPPDGPRLLGDRNGRYGREYVPTSEYGELLLLHPSEARILKAYPLPGIPPQQILLQDDAVYCVRQGDGGLPVSMLCRVDRDKMDLTVRVFLPGPDAPDTIPEDNFMPNWQREVGPTPNVFAAIIECQAGLCAQGMDGIVPFDRQTLRLRS